MVFEDHISLFSHIRKVEKNHFENVIFIFLQLFVLRVTASMEGLVMLQLMINIVYVIVHTADLSANTQTKVGANLKHIYLEVFQGYLKFNFMITLMQYPVFPFKESLYPHCCINYTVIIRSINRMLKVTNTHAQANNSE